MYPSKVGDCRLCRVGRNPRTESFSLWTTIHSFANRYLNCSIRRDTSVLQAENGRKALDLLKETPRTPFLVLLDLAMPVLNGLQFLEHRAGDPHLRRIPVVVVSGNPRPPQPLEGIEAYLQKPLEPEVLLEIIRRTRDEKLGANDRAR